MSHRGTCSTIVLAVVAAVAFGASGCRTASHRAAPQPRSTKVDLGDPTLVTVETEGVAIVELDAQSPAKTADVEVVLGLPKGAGPGAEAQGAADTTIGTFQLSRGYAYISGTSPGGGTGSGEAGVDSGIILLQSDTVRVIGGAPVPVDRFFYLEGTSGMVVRNKPLDPLEAPQTVVAPDVNAYVDIRRDTREILPPAPIPKNAGDPIFEVVQQAVSAASTKGVASPTAWPPS